MSEISIAIVNSPAPSLGLTLQAQEIGRAKECALCIPPQYVAVSRRHASVWTDSAGECWIHDLESTSGTRVNRVPLPKGYQSRIKPGDEVVLGDVQLRVLGPGETVSMDESSNEMTSTLPIGMTQQFDDERQSLDSLTPAELEIVLWMTRGFTSLEQLSEKLSRSPHTVRTHLSSIFGKLDVHSKDGLLAYLRRLPLPH
jgi:DNA-binding CsgD family transcriptional regulator